MKIIKQYFDLFDKKLPIAPASIQINLLNACFQKCIGCNKPNWPNIELSPFKVIEILDWMNLKFGESVVFSGGDPLAYQHLDKIFSHIGGLKAGILTSGLWGKDCPIDTVIEYSSHIKFSIDGASREVYKQARGVDTLDRVKENVKIIKKSAQKLNPNLQLRCDSTISKFNYHEMTEILELCDELGLEAYFFPIHTWKDLQLDLVTLAQIAAEVERAMKSPSYKNVKNNLSNFISMQLRSKPPICIIPYVHFFCDVDGKLFICCRAANDNGKYEDRDMTAVIGNIYEQKIDDIWNSCYAQIVRNNFYEVTAEYCKFCDRYNKVNQDFYDTAHCQTHQIFL